MKIIGITGGIGSGKTALLSYIKAKYNCQVLLADQVAHKLKEPGQPCYEKLVNILGKDILAMDGQIDKARMAEKIFTDSEVLGRVNEVVHPEVKRYILREIEAAGQEQKSDFLFIEAALLIEDGYKNIVDELWYIYAREDIRRERLKASRFYTDEKITGILESQLSETEYQQHCKVVIDNSGELQDTYKQIDEKLEEYL